jgi:probable phosphoglycerate mutase
MNATEKLGRPPRRRLYLMRHGDVSYFDDDGRPVPPDTVPLNRAGRLQAEAAGRELAAVPLDRVVVSGLPRTIETAAIVTARRDLKAEERPALAEIRPGRLGDHHPDEVKRMFLDAFAAGLSRESRFLGGETFGSLLDRVLAEFQAILADPAWRHLLVVAHGGVNRAILTHVLGTGLPGFDTIEQDPCCLNVLDVDPAGRCLLRLVNHTPYNAAKLGLDLTTLERLFLEYRGGRKDG